jgi:hypothetical protein
MRKASCRPARMHNGAGTGEAQRVAGGGEVHQCGHGEHRLVLDSSQECARDERADRADLRRHGLLKGSFLPPRAVVELRDLTRRRKKLLGNLAAEKNRIQKVLEVANVKIGNVISDVFGVSGQAMVSGPSAGTDDRTDDRACGADDVAGPAQSSNFYVFK